uniref:Flavin-containing monooxygenase n=1 Tax=Rhabditophanes sp. KR3021 TaxID=114890 RepID=A0AC35UFK5_9BILA
MPRNVLIIGSGASGLPACRHALLNNFNPTVFESSEDIGGLWRYKPNQTDEASVMKTTIINTSKEFTSYSDFPASIEKANFMHNTEMFKYLCDYADHHGLLKYIKLKHKVIQVERSKDYEVTGEWKVIYTNEDNEEKVGMFDAVLVCTGHHKQPHYPKPFKGQERFKGKMMHAHDYKDHKPHEDKVVVVVGVGNSGVDIAVETSRVGKQAYLATRSGVWIFHRIFDGGIPIDYAFNRRWLYAINSLLPPAFVHRKLNDYIESKLNLRFDHEAYGLKPKHRVLSGHPTTNDDVSNRISSGTLKIKPNILEFTETGVKFEDGTFVDNVDEVIFATGYKITLDLVENGNLMPVKDNHINLYKNMYPLETSHKNNIAVIGLIQPSGSIMPLSEMQARVFFENLAGKIKLPSKEMMMADIEKRQKMVSERYYASKRHTVQVDFVEAMDDYGDLIGATPKPFDYLFRDPKLFWALMFGANVSYAYRLRGNNVWEGARDAVLGCEERRIYATSRQSN